MRCINQIFTPQLGQEWTNERLLATFEEIVAELPMESEEQRRHLRDFLRFQLVGERSRRTVLPDWRDMKDFRSRADAFRTGVEEALDALAAEITPAIAGSGVQFDAVITTTSSGSLMPGISYRLARRLPDAVRTDTLMLDLAHVGCTGSIKALNLANSLDAGFKNILVVAVEIPATIANVATTELDTWQGNCTFGDGAGALWISDDPSQGDTALTLESINFRQQSTEGIDLIRWKHQEYYSFALEDPKTFDRDVRQYVVDTLSEAEAGWKDEPRWAIHPAGIALLVRISRKLGIPSESIQPSVAHYRSNSNMSSASIVHILKQVAEDAPVDAAVNLLTMGAGFNVIYGRVRKTR